MHEAIANHYVTTVINVRSTGKMAVVGVLHGAVGGGKSSRICVLDRCWQAKIYTREIGIGGC